MIKSTFDVPSHPPLPAKNNWFTGPPNNSLAHQEHNKFRHNFEEILLLLALQNSSIIVSATLRANGEEHSSSFAIGAYL
jgi:hypothetical protein